MGLALLAVAEALVEVVVAATVAVAEVELLVLEVADEVAADEERVEEGEAELTTLTGATTALPLAEEEESLPTPALVLRAVTSSAEVASQMESAEPIASTAAVSVNEPKSPEPERELT